MTSSAYLKMYFHFISLRGIEIVCWKAIGAFFNPKGSRFHSKIPSRIMNADRSLVAGSRGICQNLLTQSRTLNI